MSTALWKDGKVIRFIKLFLCILLFHLIVVNETDNTLLIFEFLIQGTIINPLDGTMEFMLYHYMLNLGLTILLLAAVLQAVSQIFEMRDYIITRCGKSKFKVVLLTAALKEIFKILAIKQVIYTAYFVYTGEFTFFYLYDMGSTFFTLLLASIQKKIGMKEIEKCLEEVHLLDEIDNKVKNYSLGMKQRLGFCQAVMENPDVLLLDEPFNALDDEHFHLILQRILGMKKDKTIVIAAHGFDTEKHPVFDQVITLNNGKIHP